MQGATSTFFVTTKYFRDDADIDYYSVPGNLEATRELARVGFDIGSHTVTHSYEFGDALAGSPGVTFETYRPVENMTINGEVRVSKELLDRDLTDQETVTFRSGYLAFPRELIGVLEDAGYRYDSSFSANDVLTTFPYFALRERRVDAEVHPRTTIVVRDPGQSVIFELIAADGAPLDYSAVRRDGKVFLSTLRARALRRPLTVEQGHREIQVREVGDT